ncbi:MAG TPA: efflux RND transporter periplasmic adaptor subunit [Dongiaceae bacterium]|jgi:multidrug efflux system membrane fusion protein|nr:efflux RND transporter periplasmic adaptor subunit [Dongiaceae bacterium]
MRVVKASVGVAVVAAAAVGVVSFVFPEVWHGGRITAADAAQPAQPAAGMPPAMPVPVDVVARTTVPVYLDYVGTTEAVRQVTLQAKVGGYIQSRGAEDGADVKEGDTLYKIDPSDYQAALDQIKAKQQGDLAYLGYAKATQKRNADLSSKGIVAKDTNDEKTGLLGQAQGTLAADAAAVRTAQLNLGYTDIKAPFDGRLGRSQVHEGALVTPQQTELNTLVQLSPIYATFNPTEADLALIEKYRAAGELTVDLFIGHEDKPRYSGKLTFLDNTVDRTTGTITARATIDNPMKELLPGQFVKVRLHLTDQPDALLVPQVALNSSQLGQFVYVVGDKGTAEQRFIETGAVLGDRIVISKGLKDGDKVITGNLQKLGPGAPVQALPQTASAS